MFMYFQRVTSCLKKKKIPQVFDWQLLVVFYHWKTFLGQEMQHMDTLLPWRGILKVDWQILSDFRSLRRFMCCKHLWAWNGNIHNVWHHGEAFTNVCAVTSSFGKTSGLQSVTSGGILSMQTFMGRERQRPCCLLPWQGILKVYQQFFLISGILECLCALTLYISCFKRRGSFGNTNFFADSSCIAKWSYNKSV